MLWYAKKKSEETGESSNNYFQRKANLQDRIHQY